MRHDVRQFIQQVVALMDYLRIDIDSAIDLAIIQFGDPTAPKPQGVIDARKHVEVDRGRPKV